MKTEHFPSLDLCKNLTKIGFPTTFQHRWEKDSTVIWCWEIPEWFYVSPSVMEMLDVIPERHKWWFLVMFKDNVWYREDWIFCVEEDWWMLEWGWERLPNALAEMILWLHENNYISFKNELPNTPTEHRANRSQDELQYVPPWSRM